MAGIDANTKLMLHFDGSDGSTTFTDSIGSHTFTAAGNAQIDTEYSVFGGASGLFDGVGDLISANDSTDWDFWGNVTEDWTVDFRVRIADRTAQRGIYCQYTDGFDNITGIYHDSTNGFVWYTRSSGTTNAYLMGGAVSDSNFHHIALIKKGGASSAEYGIYKDGTQVAYLSSSYTVTWASSFYIGTLYTYYLPGSIDEFRVQKSNYFSAAPNVGLTNTITVPTEAYSSTSTSVKDIISKGFIAAPR